LKITIEISDQPDSHVGFEGKVTEGTFDPEGPPTGALVVSQVVLSFGIPFALIPLIRLTGDRSVMGADANGRSRDGGPCACG
jgi:hypothetical protein